MYNEAAAVVKQQGGMVRVSQAVVGLFESSCPVNLLQFMGKSTETERKNCNVAADKRGAY